MFRIFAAIVLLVLSMGANARTLVVQMVGDSVITGDLPTTWMAVFGTNDDLPMDNSGYTCFKIPLHDPASGTQIGWGIDCLRDLPADPGPAVEAFSIFDMPGGVLVNHGITSLGLFSAGVGDANGQVNVMTGSIPAPGAESLIFGTKRFKNASGTARVSGAVRVGEGVEFFNCMWQLFLNDGKR
jgi:hypothetical protein